MARLALQATVATRAEVDLSPRIRREILTEMRAYESEHAKMGAADKAKRAASANVGALFEQAEQTDALMEGVELEGYTAKLVFGLTSTLDETILKRELLKLNIPLKSVEAALATATITKPSKSYVKISPPKERKIHAK